VSNFTTLEFNPSWDIKTVSGVGKLFNELQRDNQSSVSSKISQQESILLTYCADEQVLTISIVPPPKASQLASGPSLISYTALPGYVARTEVRLGREETSIFCSYTDGLGRVEWRETYTNRPRKKLNISNQRIPTHRKQLRDEWLDNLNRQIRTRERMRLVVPSAMRRLHDVIGSWSVNEGVITIEERDNYFNHTAYLDLVLGVSAYATVAEVQWKHFGGMEYGIRDRVFAALDPLTKTGTPTLSELYASTT